LLNLDAEKAVQACTIHLIRERLVQSAHDCSDGGLAVALTECCISGSNDRLGAVVHLSLNGLRRDALLFGESQSRIVLSVKAEHLERVLSLASDAAVPAAPIGTVGDNRLVMQVKDDRSGVGCRIDLELTTLYARWGMAIPRALGQG
jgi:phosphoribosylformylglycinamidine synthase subunit PurL